jgi:hypothetical protein
LSKISLVSVPVAVAVWEGTGTEKKNRSIPKPRNGTDSSQYPPRSPNVTPVSVLMSKIVASMAKPVSSRPVARKSVDSVHDGPP